MHGDMAVQGMQDLLKLIVNTLVINANPYLA